MDMVGDDFEVEDAKVQKIRQVMLEALQDAEDAIEIWEDNARRPTNGFVARADVVGLAAGYLAGRKHDDG